MMYGKYPRSVYAVYTNAAKGREQEFNNWYDHIHMPDVLALGIFDRAYRYEARGTTLSQYLTLWESDYVDLHAQMAELDLAMARLRLQGRIWPVSETLWAKPFFAAGPTQPYSHRQVTYLLTYQISCDNPARDDEFNQWHNEQHAPEYMATGYCHTAYKYKRYDTPQSKEGKFIAIYESDVPLARQEEHAKEMRDKYSAVWYERVGENRLKINQQPGQPKRPQNMINVVDSERSGMWVPYGHSLGFKP